jgi:hypothetical protein
MEMSATDRALIQSARDDLQRYLLSAELFWQTNSGSGSQQMSLTSGALLLSLRRYAVLSSGRSGSTDLAPALQKIEKTINQWRSNWIKKCEKEIPVRLTLWQNYLQDLLDDPYRSNNGFAYEIRNRVMIALLEDDLGHVSSADQKRIANVDQILKSLTIPGDFVWDPELAIAFSRDAFWFLYVGFRKG